MDHISLKLYQPPEGSADKIDFVEFFINDKPLSELLDAFYKLKSGHKWKQGILDNWIGVLGSGNAHEEIIKLKQLLNKNVTDKELMAPFPEPDQLEWHMEKYRDELANPAVLVYCCRICGDYDCGGIAVNIARDEETVTWTLADEKDPVSFRFNKYQYFEALGARLEYLQKKIRS